MGDLDALDVRFHPDGTTVAASYSNDIDGAAPAVVAPGADQEHAAERPTLTPAQVAELAGRMPPRLVALVMLGTSPRALLKRFASSSVKP